MAEPSGAVLTIEALAEHLRIPKSTLYKLVRTGSVPCQQDAIHRRLEQQPAEKDAETIGDR